jgi:LPS sulfotransferase NodH
MISQMDKCPAIERVLNQSGFLKIILIRENIVEQSLSLELAKSKNKWINDDSALEVPSKVSINIQSFSKTIQFFERCRAKLLEIGSDPNALIINYESLSKNQNACLKKVTDYLGVGPEFSYELKLKPSSDLGYEDRISNFDEVKNYLELNHPLRSDV